MVSLILLPLRRPSMALCCGNFERKLVLVNLLEPALDRDKSQCLLLLGLQHVCV